MQILDAMKTNQYSEIIFNEQDICNLVMQGRELDLLSGMLVDDTVDLESAVDFVDNLPHLVKHSSSELSVSDWDRAQQSNWHMPEEYKTLDIAEHVLSLCESQQELQRCGEELLLYQDKNLFDLLRYLVYLVDVMRDNQIIWGVGRGSSVASYVLYKLGVHKIDSMYYDLDPREFLR
jgi:DNA polymerase III alpha subunit